MIYINIIAVIVLILMQINSLIYHLCSFIKDSELRKTLITKNEALVKEIGESKYLEKFRFWNIVFFIIKSIIIGLLIGNIKIMISILFTIFAISKLVSGIYCYKMAKICEDGNGVVIGMKKIGIGIIFVILFLISL